MPPKRRRLRGKQLPPRRHRQCCPLHARRRPFWPWTADRLQGSEAVLLAALWRESLLEAPADSFGQTKLEREWGRRWRSRREKEKMRERKKMRKRRLCWPPHAAPRHATPCHAMLCNVMLCYVMLCEDMHDTPPTCQAMLHSTIARLTSACRASPSLWKC
jgi:hypothetical protein